MDERKIVACFIVKLWYLNVVTWLMMWFMKNRNCARRRNRQLALRNRTFVRRMVGSAYLDRLNFIFGKDRATGVGAITLTEMMDEPKQIPVNEDEDEVETSSPSVARTSSTSSTQKRKRSTLNDDDLTMAFKEMLSESVNKLGVVLQAAFGKGLDPNPEIASELTNMDLSIEDQIKALNIIFEKPQNERTFLSLDGAMKKSFVLMLLGQINRN